MPSVAVVIPWRGGDKERERNYEITLKHFSTILPGVPVISSDTDSQVFSRAGARNQGVRQAEILGAETVIICDADTLPERQPVLDAVAACSDGVLHLPYRRYRSLTKKGKVSFLDGVDLLDCEVDHDHENSTGGILVIQIKSWYKFGAMDEGYIDWGFEDTDARIRADALLGPTIRHEGIIHHLWHEPEWGLGSEGWLRNKARCEELVAVEGNIEAVRSLVESRKTKR